MEYIKDPDLTSLNNFLLGLFSRKFYADYFFCVNTFSDSSLKIYLPIYDRRSLPDIFEICKVYFKDVTIEEVAEALVKLDGAFFRYCPNISKWVFLRNLNKDSITFNSPSLSYSHHDCKGVDGLSLMDILKLGKYDKIELYNEGLS